MSFGFITQKLRERQSEALLRERVCIDTPSSREIEVAGKRYLNFASNDYLGLAQEQLVSKACLSGSRSSALVTGYLPVHQHLEQKLCDTLGYESALLFGSGFSANSSVIKALFQDKSCASESALFLDKLSHASLIDGGLESNAKFERFNHNDIRHLTARLEKSKAVNKLIITEGVFSMDGDIPDIEKLNQVKSNHNAWLMLDDAHAFGVVGKHGLGSVDFGIKPEILVITFGKAMGCQGAAVLGSKALIQYMLQFNRDYIYSTSLAPILAETAIVQLERLKNADEQRKALNANISHFRALAEEAGIALISSQTPIQPIVLGGSEETVSAQKKLAEAGIWLTAIRPPTVPHNTARLRLTVTAAHTQDDIQFVVEQLKRFL